MKDRRAPRTCERRIRCVDLREKVNQELPFVCGTLYGHACLYTEPLHSWAVLEDAGAVKMQ